jgi:SNF2 family DNA or RNA helicase
MYLLSDSRIKKLLREFDFYGVRFYREERTKEHTVCIDYPKGNVYWFLDFKRAVETDILASDARYEKEWNTLLSKLKKVIKIEFNDLKEKLNAITAYDVVAAMVTHHLRDYQAYDLLQLVIKMQETPEAPSGLILSEQRTGKTRVALAATHLFLEKGACVVIVSPKTGIPGWVSEIEALNKAHGSDIFSPTVIRHTKDLSKTFEISADTLNVKIITYELFKLFTYAQLRKLCNLKYSNKVMFIGDEIHRLRNFKTLQSTAIFQFKEGCLKDKVHLHTIGVTGTPAVKDSTDIFGLFSLINHSKIGFQPYYKDFNLFKEYFYNCEDTSYGKICKSLKRTDELNYLMQISAIQTKKRELDLFKNYELKYLKYTLDMDEKQAEIYHSVEKDMEYEEDIDCINSLVQLTRLQQICIDPSGLVASYDLCAPKIKWAADFIKKAHKKSYKGIVMAKKLQPLKALASKLAEEGLQYTVINGTKSLSERKDAVDEFCNNPDVSIILIQLDVGRESLTLPQAKYTLFFDRDYAQGFNEQAEARMTPIDGKPVTKYVIDLVMRGTREEEIYDTLVIRKQTINTVNDVFKKSARKEEG